MFLRIFQQYIFFYSIVNNTSFFLDEICIQYAYKVIVELSVDCCELLLYGVTAKNRGDWEGRQGVVRGGNETLKASSKDVLLPTDN